MTPENGTARSAAGHAGIGVARLATKPLGAEAAISGAEFGSPPDGPLFTFLPEESCRR